jgi:hypothetical protein
VKNPYLPSIKITVLKKGLSILLLSLLAFNWVGYRLLSGFMESKADVALEAKIDHSDYDESSLIEIRVPLNAPYLSDNTTEFQRYDGELELDGVHYKYVKRKVVNGELVLLCIPNKSKTELQNSREEFFKLVNDLNQTQNKSKSTASSFKSITTEYKKENNAWAIAALPLIQQTHNITFKSYLASGYHLLPEHPPKD